MIFARRRRARQLEEASAIARRLDIYSRESLAEHVVGLIIDYILKSKARTVEEIIDDVLRTCREVSWLGDVCVYCRMIESLYEQAEEYGIEEMEYFKKALILARRRLDLALAGEAEQYIGVLDTHILHGSTLLVLSFTELTKKAISTLRYKLSRVLVPMRSPLDTGVAFAAQLKKMGIDSVYYIPDEPLAWAVEAANYILADAAGSAHGGRLIVDTTVPVAAQMGAERSTETLVVVGKQAACETREVNVAERLPYIILESRYGGPHLKLRLLDILDPKTVRFKMVTENDVLDASREVVRERQRVIDDVITDIVQYILNQPL